MGYFNNFRYNNHGKPQQYQKSDSDRTRKELNARKQLSRFDDHFNDPATTVRLDSTYSSKSGNRKTRYIVSRNGEDKYVAKFTERNNRQKLEQIALIKHTKTKPKEKKGSGKK